MLMSDVGVDATNDATRKPFPDSVSGLATPHLSVSIPSLNLQYQRRWHQMVGWYHPE